MNDGRECVLLRTPNGRDSADDVHMLLWGGQVSPCWRLLSLFCLSPSCMRGGRYSVSVGREALARDASAFVNAAKIEGCDSRNAARSRKVRPSSARRPSSTNIW